MFRIQLKKFRELSEYKSQSTFANAIGVSQSTVGNWESGTREPSLKMILKIAQTLNVSVDELLCNSTVSAPKSSLIYEASGYWDGNRLRDERDARGYSVVRISSLLDISTEEYISLESGSFEPSFALMLRLADVFSHDLDYFCHRMMKLDEPSTKFNGTENLLIKMYRALDERGQSAVWNTLNHEYDSLSGEEANPAPKEA